jgi:hypothetical protein
MDSMLAMPVPVHMFIEAMSLGIGISLLGALRPAWEASRIGYGILVTTHPIY